MAPVLDPFSPVSVVLWSEDEVGVKTTVRVTMTPLSVTTVALVLGCSFVVGWAEELGARLVVDGGVLCKRSQ